CFGRVLPVCADRLPAVAEALDIRIAVLRDDCGDALGVPHREAETSRRAVVEDIDGEAAKSDHFSEAVNSHRYFFECVAELGPFRHVRLAKPGQIGRNHMKSVGELRNEIAEHVACSRKAVQQKECRSVRATGLSVENFDAVDGYSPVSDLSHFVRHGPRQPNVPIQPTMARPISSGESSCRKWSPATVTSVCAGNPRGESRFAPPATSNPGSAFTNSLGTPLVASQFA